MNLKGLLILFLVICMLFSVTACVNPFDKDDEGSGNGDNVNNEGEIDGDGDKDGAADGDGSDNGDGGVTDNETNPDLDDDTEIELPPINV